MNIESELQWHNKKCAHTHTRAVRRRKIKIFLFEFQILYRIFQAFHFAYMVNIKKAKYLYAMAFLSIMKPLSTIYNQKFSWLYLRYAICVYSNSSISYWANATFHIMCVGLFVVLTLSGEKKIHLKLCMHNNRA